MSRSTAKSASRETDWSEWEWNTRGHWESWRYNSRGLVEWRQDPPSSSTSTKQISRHYDLHSLMPSSSYSASQTPPVPEGFGFSGTATEKPLDMYISPEESSFPWSSTPQMYGGDDSYGKNDPYEATSSSSVRTLYPGTMPSGSYSINTSEPSDPSVGEPNLLEDAMGGLSLNSPGSVPTRRIASSRHKSKAEKLDPRYRMVPSKESRSFWKVGRVFMMLWTEPAGYKHGGTRNGSHISGTWLNERAFSEIRRFVVVRDHHGYAMCLSIHTYNGWATLKENLRDPENHAVIYTTEKPPAQFSVSINGQEKFESLTKDPIKVISERKDKDGRLSSESRIDYNKIYTVEKDVRVLNIGIVSSRSIPALLFDCPLKPEPSSRKSRDSTLNDNWPPSRPPRFNVGESSLSAPDSDSNVTFERFPSVGNSAVKLNDRYQIIGFPSRFFKKGRVFKALWTEPAGDISYTEDAFVIPSKFGENAFTKIRHFVVVREKEGCCLCLMLNTYNRQGATKDGLKPENYAAVFPLEGEPEVSPEENLTKDPFPIKVEEAGETIDPTSRINFGRVYTIEHNIKVMKVGRIPDPDLPKLEEYFVSSIVGPSSQTKEHKKGDSSN